MSAADFADIMAVMGPELSGPGAPLLAGGIVAATVANCHRGKDTAPFVPADFLPGLPGAKRQGEPQEGSGADFVAAMSGSRHG